MKVWVYSIVRGTPELAPYFLLHYEQFADRIVIFEHGNENREALTKSDKVDWRPWVESQSFDDMKMQAKAEREGAVSKADWVLWVDFDELIYHRNMRSCLARHMDAGTEVIKPEGWNMVCPEFVPFDPDRPRQAYQSMPTGVRSDVYSKPVIFQPKSRIEWWWGKHKTKEGMEGKVVHDPEVKLLHFRYLGVDYTRKRNETNWSRLSKYAREHGFGWTCNPDYKGEHSAEWVKSILADNQPKRVLQD